MPWALVDDGFHDHPKVLALLDYDDALAAIGLWTLCLAWAKSHADPENPGAAGRIPRGLLRRLGATKSHADLLVKVGLWVDAGADGWRIHEFVVWQQLDIWKARRDAGKRGGRPRKGSSEPSGNHVVMHDETTRVTETEPIRTGHVTDRTRQDTLREEEPDGSSSSSEPSASDGRKDRPGDRDDVERVCQHLADRVEQQTGKRPGIGVRWRSAARYIIDIDHRTEDQIHHAIDWCQDDEFWRSNILSMPTLRAKWIQLRAAAQRDRRRSTTNDRMQQGLDLAARYADEERRAIGE